MSWSTGGPCPRVFKATIDGKSVEARDFKQIFVLYRIWKDSIGERLPNDWEESVWLALKSSHPRHFQKAKRKASPGVSVASAASFISFVAKAMKGRNRIVGVDLARKRAEICRSCPMKEPVLGCSVCKSALKVFVKPPESLNVPQACGACGCFLPLKVWVFRSYLGEASTFPFHENCWMHSEPYEP